ncbi:hypothetical protein [Microcystis phage Mae-JY24]
MTPTKTNSQVFETRSGRTVAIIRDWAGAAPIQTGLKPLDGVSSTQWDNHTSAEVAMDAARAHVKAWNAQEARRG